MERQGVNKWQGHCKARHQYAPAADSFEGQEGTRVRGHLMTFATGSRSLEFGDHCLNAPQSGFPVPTALVDQMLNFYSNL